MSRKELVLVLLGLIVGLLIFKARAEAAGYEDALGKDVARVMGGSSEKIPDDVEEDYWRCWARGFVATQVRADDRPKLDAGDRALIDATGRRVEEVLMNPDGRANYAVEDWMDRQCPQVVDKIRSY